MADKHMHCGLVLCTVERQVSVLFSLCTVQLISQLMNIINTHGVVHSLKLPCPLMYIYIYIAHLAVCDDSEIYIMEMTKLSLSFQEL